MTCSAPFYLTQDPPVQEWHSQRRAAAHRLAYSLTQWKPFSIEAPSSQMALAGVMLMPTNQCIGEGQCHVSRGLPRFILEKTHFRPSLVEIPSLALDLLGFNHL